MKAIVTNISPTGLDNHELNGVLNVRAERTNENAADVSTCYGRAAISVTTLRRQLASRVTYSLLATLQFWMRKSVRRKYCFGDSGTSTAFRVVMVTRYPCCVLGRMDQKPGNSWWNSFLRCAPRVCVEGLLQFTMRCAAQWLIEDQNTYLHQASTIAPTRTWT